MRIFYAVTRTLLGLAFFVLGLNGFLHFIPAQMPSGEAGTFMLTLFATKYYIIIFGAQALAGALLLVNRFVPLALVVLAPILVNILAYHVTMMPQGLPLALVAAALWFAVAIPLRGQFAPLLAPIAHPAR